MFPSSYDAVCLLAGSHMSRVRVSVTSERWFLSIYKLEVSSNVEPCLTLITTTSSLAVTCLKTKKSISSSCWRNDKIQNTGECLRCRAYTGFILNKDQFLSHSTILVPNQVEVMISPLALAVRRLRRELELQHLLTTTLPSCIYIHVYAFIYKTHHRHYSS